MQVGILVTIVPFLGWEVGNYLLLILFLDFGIIESVQTQIGENSMN